MAWRGGGACVTGVQHERSGTAGQDFCAVFDGAPGALIFLVADGAGSMPHGGDGAALCGEVAQEFWRDHVLSPNNYKAVFSQFMDQLQGRLDGAAETLGVARESLASTCLLAVCQGEAVYTMQVGDGRIIWRQQGADTYNTFKKADSEFVNETAFVTDKSPPLRLQYMRKVGFLALMTDGLEPVSIHQEHQHPHAPFFRPFDDFLQARPGRIKIEGIVQDFLKSPRLREKCSDDVTLLIGGDDG